MTFKDHKDCLCQGPTCLFGSSEMYLVYGVVYHLATWCPNFFDTQMGDYCTSSRKIIETQVQVAQFGTKIDLIQKNTIASVCIASSCACKKNKLLRTEIIFIKQYIAQRNFYAQEPFAQKLSHKDHSLTEKLLHNV